MNETTETPQILIGVGKPEAPFPTEKRYAFALANASPEDQEIVDDINIILEGVSAFDIWSRSHQEEKPTDLPSWLAGLYKESEDKNELLDAMRDLNHYKRDSKKDRASLHARIKQTISTNPPTTTIVKESSEEIHVLQKELDGILHDIGNPFGAILGFSTFAIEDAPNFDYEKFTPIIQNAFTRISHAIENGNNILNKTYPKEPLTAENLRYYLYKRGSPSDLTIKVPKAGEYPEIPGATQWSPAWLEQLTDNIIQNTQKAYRAAGEMGKPIDKPTLAISFQSEDPHHIDILYDDNGTGFPQDIVEGGFKSGRTQWEGGVQGTGTGMAFHADTLEKEYGGKLIPTNRIDANGTILGGRLIVRLPINTM